MNVQSQPKMSIDAFFTWAEGQERKYELVNGVPHLQPWVKRSHSLIVGNIDFALRSRLQGSDYAVHQGDFAIATGPKSIRYADVLVEPAGAALDERTSENAILIVEVLSESTMHVDFGPKRAEYAGLPSLDTYLVVAQDKRHVWQWTRGDDGVWPVDPLLITNGHMSVQRLGVAIPVDEIYRNVR